MPQRQFSVCFYFQKDAYTVLPLTSAHPDVAEKAYRLIKRTGQGEVYDVRLTRYGAECDCPGFQHWGHCKHVAMLVAFGCLPEQPEPKERVTMRAG